ncbi:MAG: TonB-dependent receptor [Pseudomonadota bacterium]
MTYSRKFAAALAASVCIVAIATPANAQTRTYNVPAGSLKSALDAYARQSGRQVIYKSDEVRSARSPGAKGPMSADAALRALLSGTGFTARGDASGAIAIVRSSIPSGESQAGNAAADDESVADDERGKAEILVVGSRSQNVDIPRTENDTQPYVVFGSTEITNSGALTLDQFLASRLSANAQSSSIGQAGTTGVGASTGSINLRGLGTNQTLILVDGRRIPSVSIFGTLNQPSIAGIPLSSIERVEVLPTTAGAAYGGSATGGVINIVLKRNYQGLDIEVLYGDTFRADASVFRASVGGGFTINRTHTKVTFSASYSGGSRLYNSERSFSARAAARVLANDPNAFFFDAGGAICSTLSFSANAEACNGGPLTLDNGVPVGSNRTIVPPGYVGPITAGDGGTPLAANSGRLSFAFSPRNLLTTPTTDAQNLNIRQPLTGGISAYVDLSRDSSLLHRVTPQIVPLVIPAASNPFQQNILVNLQLPDNVLDATTSLVNKRIAAGVIAKLPAHWTGSIDYQWARSEVSSRAQSFSRVSPAYLTVAQQAAFTDTSIIPILNNSSLLDLTRLSQPARTELTSIAARAGGPLLRLPGGSLNLSAVVEHREERAASAVSATLTPFINIYLWSPATSTAVNSGYAEMRAPLVSRSTAIPLISDLELMAAVRSDHYETKFAASSIAVPSENGPFPSVQRAVSTFSSVDYTLGLRYSPVPGITFRSSYGTGFLPPPLSFTRPNAPSMPLAGVLDLTDPKRGNMALTGDGTGHVTTITGGNQNIEPERSKSLSYGVIVSPPFLPGLRLSADVTSIRKTGEITPPDPQYIINNETEFPGRIARGVNLPGDPVGWAGPIIGIDQTAVNLFKSQITAIDFTGDYSFKTSIGSFNAYLNATTQSRLERQVTASGPTPEYAGKTTGPLKWRGNVGLDWNKGNWRAGWNMQYFGRYEACTPSLTASACALVVLRQGSKWIPSQTYNDLYIGYRFGDRISKALEGTEVTVAIQNVFDHVPPIVANDVSYSTYGDPRLRRFTLELRKHF